MSGSTSRRYLPGQPYRKHLERGNREYLLEPYYWTEELAGQIVRIVEAEGPIHQEMLVQRLKEINVVERAGSNVQGNIQRAIGQAVRSRRTQRLEGDFLKAPQAKVPTFRTPGDAVERPLAWIPPEEIQLAVLYIVEDQLGLRRDALPKVVGELLGFERTPVGLAEAVGTAVDDLIDRNLLAASGPFVRLS
jgi:hypothetical protein